MFHFTMFIVSLYSNMWNLESIFEYKRQKLKKEHAHFKILSRGEVFTLLFFFYFFHPGMKLHPCLFDRNEFIPGWNFISTKTCKRHFSIDRDDFIPGRVSSQNEFSRVYKHPLRLQKIIQQKVCISTLVPRLL